MPEYDRFISITRHILKKAGNTAGTEQVAELHDAFTSCMAELPENMMHDIAYHFEEACSRTESAKFLELLVTKLSEVLYLFEEEYDRVEETFSVADW